MAEKPTYAPRTLKKWQLRAPTKIGEFGIFSVTRSALFDAEGREKRHVHTFEVRDWCNIVPVTPEGEVLLVWQYRFGTGEFSLELPGGVVDEGEAPMAAAIRELKEEAGATSPRVELLSVLEPNPALQGNLLHSYVAWDTEVEEHATDFDELEELESLRVPIADLPALLDRGVIRHALCTTVLEMFLRRYVREPALGAEEAR